MHILPTSIYTTSLLLSYAFTEIFYRPSFSQHIMTHQANFAAATHCKQSRTAADRAWLGHCVTVELQ